MNPNVVRFSELARTYISWVEEPVNDRSAELLKAQTHIAQLYAAALTLPDLYGDEEEPEIPESDWDRTFKRFGSMPFNYYVECFNPHNVPDEKPVVGDVADDLADIWSDVKSGLILYDSGDEASATWVWRFTFQNHWGRHAASAIYAMHCWE